MAIRRKSLRLFSRRSLQIDHIWRRLLPDSHGGWTRCKTLPVLKEDAFNLEQIQSSMDQGGDVHGAVWRRFKAGQIGPALGTGFEGAGK
jgi:hypothetical protein